MDVSYSSSSVVGYKDSLYDYHIKLPLTYPTNTTTSVTSSPNVEFQKQTAILGEIIKFSSHSIVNAASISILNDLKTIILTPLEFQLNAIGFRLQNLVFDLPHPVISTSCVTIQYIDDNIIIDFIDESYLCTTLKISVDNFVLNQRLSLDNFEKWGQISVPYSFELRSAPFYVKHLDGLNLIISLKDGGLLHFKRQEILGDFTVNGFQEPTPMLSFFGLFGKSNGNKNKEIVLEGISSNSIVDSLRIGDFIVTLSVSKVLKVWQLETHQHLESISLAEDDDDSWLTSIPCKYFKHINHNDKQYIIFFINTKSGDSSKSMFVFKTFEFEGPSIRELLDFSFQPEVPNALLSSLDVFYHESSFQNTIWFIQDYDLQIVDNVLEYHMLWKSNTSSILVKYSISLTTGSILSIKISHPGNLELGDEDLSAYHSTDYYFDKIFDSGSYDKLIVTTALRILNQHGQASIQFNDDIRQVAQDIIKSQTTPETAKNYWFKLQSLCDEFKKLSDEALSLTIFEDRVLTSHVNGYGIFRPSNYFESFVNKTVSSPDGQLMSIFNKFRTVISNRSYHKLYEELLQQKKITGDNVTLLFTKFVEGKISPSEIQVILNELEKIPDAVELVKSIIGNNGFELISNDQNENGIGIFNKIATIVTFKNIITAHESLLMDLVILLIICETNEQLVEFLNEIRTSLWNYTILGTIFDTCLQNDKVETKSIGQLQNSIFWTLVVSEKRSQLGVFINDSQLNEAFDYLYNDVLISSDYLTDVVAELINDQEGFYLKAEFLNKLNQNNTIDKFLLGLIYLFTNDGDSFYKVFENYETFKNIESKEKLELLTKNSQLSEFLNVLFNDPSKGQYYHALSKLTQSQIRLNNKSIEIETRFIEIASEFEILAIDSESNNELEQEYYLNLFDLSLSVSNYDTVTKCLNNLTTSNEFKKLFDKFITKTVIQLKLDIILPLNSNKKEYGIYRDYFSLVDEIILKIANEANLSQSLKIYQYLYSWRLFGANSSKDQVELGDKRGAIEALYRFITRFKLEHVEQNSERKVKLKILELYMIILNVFKSFTEDQDKWILKYSNNERSIVQLNDLKVEYLEWLKVLDDDLSMFV